MSSLLKFKFYEKNVILSKSIIEKIKKITY